MGDLEGVGELVLMAASAQQPQACHELCPVHLCIVWNITITDSYRCSVLRYVRQARHELCPVHMSAHLSARSRASVVVWRVNEGSAGGGNIRHRLHLASRFRECVRVCVYVSVCVC